VADRNRSRPATGKFAAMGFRALPAPGQILTRKATAGKTSSKGPSREVGELNDLAA
jgi:hypothetical protein